MSDFSVQEMVQPARHHYTVVFSDTVDIVSALGGTGQKQPRSLYFNSAGNASITDGNNNTFIYAVTAGMTLTLRAKRVNATGTTVAAGSVAAWF